ncbi:AMP-binding protein [Vannielia litorea]|uniref:AMP-binding enzyme n=1 Tax=Vannielia litorea TaxID=1217970 RepID=A0A1N6IGP1_9RHOB|nr:AMP-binding protein [Vannielia litorea]SIO31197.1 AMP-binding enzyme [Vannielia litorea]
MNSNAALYFVDRHVTEGRAEKPAFREADGAKRSQTYGELSRESARFAGALIRHGLRREERVAMIVHDQIEFPVVFWGAMKAGAIPVTLNTLLAAPDYEATRRPISTSAACAAWKTGSTRRSPTSPRASACPGRAPATRCAAGDVITSRLHRRAQLHQKAPAR